MSELEQAIAAFEQRWGFRPDLEKLDLGTWELAGGTEDQRAFIRELLGDELPPIPEPGTVSDDRLAEIMDARVAWHKRHPAFGGEHGTAPGPAG